MTDEPTDRPGGESTPRGRRVGLALAAIAVLLALPSLAFPFGRDQGLYFYVAREWVHRGSLPYRDVLDHKTLGIYVVHALAIVCFGDKLWGIRVFDTLAYMLVGVFAALVVTPRGEKVRAGLLGASCLVAAVLFVGYLGFWDTAQSEIWYGMLGLGSCALAGRIRKEGPAAFASGLLSGAAFVMKPPAVWLVLVAVGVLFVRLRDEHATAWPKRPLLLAAARFSAGFLLFPGLVAAYFGAHHAIPAMLDIIVGANGYYVQHEKGATSVGEALTRTQEYVAFYQPASTLGTVLVAAFLFRVRKVTAEQKRRWGIATALVLAAIGGVAMQQKYYLLHWGVMIPAATVVFVAFLYELDVRGLFGPSPEKRGLVVVVVLAAAFASSGAAAQRFYVNTERTLAYVTGHVERDRYLATFDMPFMHFSAKDDAQAADYLRAHTTPDDFVTVRGFSPQVYALAERRHHGRFFWTSFLTQTSRAYRRPEWLKEDLNALAEKPPKFVVVLRDEREGPDSAAYFPDYEPRATFGEHLVLGRKGER
jgi:hypothetical protein